MTTRISSARKKLGPAKKTKAGANPDSRSPFPARATAKSRRGKPPNPAERSPKQENL